jgi:hypothetical protein
MNRASPLSTDSDRKSRTHRDDGLVKATSLGALDEISADVPVCRLPLTTGSAEIRLVAGRDDRDR